MGAAMKNRVAALEACIGVNEDLPKAIIISVVDGNTDAPKRTDEADCIGLLSSYGGPRVKIVRQEGESLESLDDRAGLYNADLGGIACWTRIYRDDVSQEPDDRASLYQQAQEVAA